MEEIIAETLTPLLQLMHADFNKINVEEESEGHYRVNIESDEPRHLIGHHGATLQAIQHLLKIFLTKKAETHFSVTVDVDNYRRKQEESVIQMTEERVNQLRKDRTPQTLPPMSSYFRRLVHLHLTKEEFEDIKTHSEGEGNFRAVVITTV